MKTQRTSASDAHHPDDLRIVHANGLDHACLISGDGPLVLLLHGFPDGARTWDPLRARLAAKGYRVVAPYLRGYAPTGIPSVDTTSQDLGEDVLGLLDAFDADQAVVVGHDWGALAAYSAVGMAEERFRGLVALAIPHPGGFKPKWSDLWGIRHFAEYKLPGAHRRFARNDFAGLHNIVKRWSPDWEVPEGEFDDVLDAFSTEGSLNAAFGYYRALSSTVPPFLRKKLSLPTLAICGEGDTTAPTRAFGEVRRKFTGQYTVVPVPGGHFPQRESATQVERLIEDFLASL